MSEEDLNNVANVLAQQSEEVQTRLKEAQNLGIESAKQLLNTLEIIKTYAQACKPGEEKSARDGTAKVEALRMDLASTQKSETLKYQEQIRIAKNNLDASNKKIVDLEAKLQECIETGKKTTPIGQPQLEQIRKLEQQRLASSAEAQVMRKERDALSEKLDKFSTTVSRIAALRKKCASQGKSLADEIGESMALQLNDVESKQKQNIIEQQRKFDDFERKLKQIEGNLADAYEQECILRDEQQKSQDNVQNQNQIELALQTELRDEQRKLADASSNLVACETRQKVISDSLAETEKELAKLKEQFAELYQVDLTRKENQEYLQQQINELEQENKTLLNKQPQGTAAIPKNQEKENLEEELQRLKRENTTLREQLQSNARQIAGLKTNEAGMRKDAENFLEQIQALGKQVDQLKAENLAYYKKNDEYIAEITKLKDDLDKSIREAAEAAAIGKRLLKQLTGLE